VFGVDLPGIIFPSTARQQVKNALSNVHFGLKKVGVKFIMSREKFEKSHYSGKTYEDYVDREKFMLEDSFRGNDILNALTPVDVLLIEHAKTHEDRNATCLAALYSIY